MARIVWSGAARPQRRDSGTVYYTSPFTPLQRQGAVPIASGRFAPAHAAAGFSLAAFTWTSVFGDAQKALWAAAAPTGLTGYQYFLQLTLPIIAFEVGGPAVPYTPANIAANALITAYTDHTTGRMWMGYFGDFPTEPPLPLTLNVCLQVSDLFQFQVSGFANSPPRYQRAPSGFIAFGSLGPLVTNEWVQADITDAIMAVFGQTPTDAYYPPGINWGVTCLFNTMCYYVDDSFQITTLNNLAPFPASEPWGLDPLMAAQVRSARQVSFTPSRHVAHRMGLRAS
jgi:hypothetical protein